MQFPEKIVSIKPGDKVLDIGPGGNPHPKATVYLELRMSEEEAAGQRGYAEKPDLKGEVVYYDGEKFPFKDKEFDYVICSHVIEHVPDPEKFLKEMFRVAKRGYMEYPTVYYEYLYNFKFHLNFVKTDSKLRTLYFLPKHETSFQDFYPVQKAFYQSLEKGHSSLVVVLSQIMFEGYEWEKPFAIRKAKNLDRLLIDPLLIPDAAPAKKELTLWQHIRSIIDILKRRTRAIVALKNK